MADLVELVAHVDHGLLRPQDAAEVDRRPAHDDVAGSRVDRLLEFFDLLRAIAHGREDLPGVRIFLVRLPDRTDRVADRADDLGGAAATMTASGLSVLLFPFWISTLSGVAVSTLLITRTSAIRRFVSPG